MQSLSLLFFFKSLFANRLGLRGIAFAIFAGVSSLTVFPGSALVVSAATPAAGGPVVLALAAGDSITVVCPNTLNLGTYDTGATTNTFTVTCVPDHNVSPRGNMTVTSSPASNSMNVTNGAFTYAINFSTFTTSSGTLTGNFATGITLLNTRRNGFNFRYNVRPQTPVPVNAASGVYSGTHTLTFSLF